MIDVTLDFSTEATHAESAGAPSSSLSPSSIPSARRNLPPPIAQGSTGPQAASIADPDTPESRLEISHSQLGSIPGRDIHSRAGSTEAVPLPRGRTSSRASEPPPRTSQRAKSRQPQATSNSSRPRSVVETVCVDVRGGIMFDSGGVRVSAKLPVVFKNSTELRRLKRAFYTDR